MGVAGPGVAPTGQVSPSQRLQLLWFGLDQWQQRPWWGGGANVSDDLLEQSAGPGIRREGEGPLRHLQNTYLELLVQLGLVGLVAFLLPIGGLLVGLRRACRTGRVPADLCLFFGGALLFTLLWCGFDYRVVHHDWRVFWVLLMGSAYSLVLKWPLSDLGGPRGAPNSR